MNKTLFLGMAIQAFNVAMLSYYGLITVTPLQQLMVGVGFFATWFVLAMLEGF